MIERETILFINFQDSDVLHKHLGTFYGVECANSSTEGLSFFERTQPNLVILDNDPPGVDTYEICKNIRALNEHNDIPILFVSNQNLLEEKLKGYEAGGDDYISKPYNNDELLVKVKSHLTRYKNTTTLREELDDVTRSAINALINTNELDVLVNFTNNSLSTHSYDELIEAIFKALDNYGLNGCAQLRSQLGTKNYSMQGELAPLEREIFEVYIEQEEVIHFSNKSVFNREHVSLLVKNMPIQNTHWFIVV